MNAPGPARDREIAVLRGDDCIADVEEIGCRGNCTVCDNWAYKPYSTDISAALELWGEMKASGKAVELSSHSEWGMICRFVSDKPTIYSASGETEADAISGAYLKWRNEG